MNDDLVKALVQKLAELDVLCAAGIQRKGVILANRMMLWSVSVRTITHTSVKDEVSVYCECTAHQPTVTRYTCDFRL